jgi:hypothetical protein
VDYIDLIGQLLSQAGVDIDPGQLRTAVITLLVVVAGSVAYAVGKPLARWSKRQIDEEFWRHPGKLATAVSTVLLVLAYGFYGADQSESLTDELIDLGRDRLAGVMPLAILTQWVLLCACWTLFGLLLGIPRPQLLRPLRTIGAFLTFTALLILYTVLVMSLLDGDFGTAAPAAAAIVGIGYLAAVATSKKRWRVPLRQVLTVSGVWLGILGLLTALATIALAAANLPVPTLDEAITFDLVGASVLFLFACYRYRADVLNHTDVDPVLLHFIDFTVALSACAIAISGLPNSPVTLGPVPTWLIAVGPPVLVAAMVFGVHLARKRATTPAWAVCLTASVVAGVLVGPARIVLGVVLSPVAGMLPTL